MTNPVDRTQLAGARGLAHVSPSAALSEPITPVARAWVAALTLANIGMWAAFLGPLQVLPAERAGDHAPIVALTDGYVTLYVVAAVVCFVGSAFVGRIRSVE